MTTENDLRALWQEAFGDTDAFLDGFFSVGFSPERVMTAHRDGRLAGALYWFDCACRGQKLAYIYAVATAKAFRGQGVCRGLMEKTHELLKAQGYAGTVLVPVTPDVAGLYAKLGYRPFGGMARHQAMAKGSPLPLQELTAAEYRRQREARLSGDGVLQDGITLDFLGTYARFFAADGCLFAIAQEDGIGYFQEFFGDETAISGILNTLGCQKGHYRTPDESTPFAMYLPLTPNCPTPTYLGLPLD